jgi:inhibitor of cysteine peptidase
MRLPILQVSLDTRKLASFAFIAFLVGGALGGVLFNYGGVYVPTSDLSNMFGYMQQFQSFDELKNYLTERASGDMYWSSGVNVRGFGFGSDVMIMESSEFAEVSSLAAEAKAAAGTADSAFGHIADGGDYSGTNIQVEGVDEADIVKTDGQFIYFAKGTEVIIVQAYPVSEAKVVSRINMSNPVQDIYISSDRLIVFTSQFPEPMYFYEFDRPNEVEYRSILTIYDIADRSNPEEVREINMDGTYFNSRLIDNYLYFIIRNSAYIYEDDVPLPVIREGDTWSSIEANCIWYPNNTRGWMSYNTIASIDVQSDGGKLTTETFLLDEGSSIYVSPTNMYLTSEGWWRETKITKIGIEEGEIKFKANGTVPGYVLNQYSMDEKDGYFRIATSGNNNDRRSGNNLFVLNEALETVGSVEGLAKGEQIYSTRFMGDRCYMVTFKITDPLFTIDLSDPENPEVLGALKIPGFSTYLHPYDENILIGIGKETVESKTGDFAWQRGVKISLFDVSDITDPKEMAKLEVGDRGSDSNALYDPHAFLFSKARNLLVLPILEAQIDETDFADGEAPPDWYGEYVNQGAYVFDISEDGIELRGTVSHIEDPEEYLKSGYWFESDLQVQRSLYIEENLYTLSNGMIKVNNIQSLEELAVIDLGE